MAYNWELPDWPNFTFDIFEIENFLFDFARKEGRNSGLFEGLNEKERLAVNLDLMVSEAVKTSEIEGEYLKRTDVMSSIRINLGLEKKNIQVLDQKAIGASELIISVRESFNEPISEEILFTWHRMIMRGSRINAGKWRSHSDPMQVISGAIGREDIHFEAPPSHRIEAEMNNFILWFNETAPGGPREISRPPVRSAITHIYFESIHPFEDGNGRIGRALSEKAISQGIGQQALISLSRTIESNKSAYYDALKIAQKSNSITQWIVYFVNVLIEAQIESEKLIEFTLKKTRFFDRFKNMLNERQLLVSKRMLREGPKGFSGGMSASKYMSIAKTTKATATRDLQDLAKKGAYFVEGGGRSTRYYLNIDQ